jgi:hypothetical protein
MTNIGDQYFYDKGKIPTKLWPISTQNNYFFRHVWLIDKYVMLSMFMLSFTLGDSCDLYGYIYFPVGDWPTTNVVT